MRKRTARLIGAGLLVLAVGHVSGCTEGFLDGIKQATQPAPGEPGRYDRDAFGGWADLDRDRCNTREEVLARDSGTGDCPPKAPHLLTITDPYTGETVTGRSEIDIDHVVSLRDAWDSGAWAWPEARRVEFANSLDPVVAGCPNCSELVAASDDVNRAKSDESVGEWVAPTAAGRCFHAVTYQAVKQHWGLAISPAQRAAIDDMLGTCPAGGAR